MRLVAVIQARMGSSRLPGKVLADIGGRSMLQRVIERAQAIEKVADVCVATTLSSADDPVVDLCEWLRVLTFRGHPFDVLDRYYHAALAFGAKHIVRITADCPLLDPDVSSRVVRAYVADGGRYDYVSNVDPPTFPDGHDTEVFSLYILGLAHRLAKDADEREHVTVFFRRHPEMVRSLNVYNSTDQSKVMLSVNTAADLARVRAMAKRRAA